MEEIERVDLPALSQLSPSPAPAVNHGRSQAYDSCAMRLRV